MPQSTNPPPPSRSANPPREGDADVTALLQAWQAGDASAFEHLARHLHHDFLRMAASRLSSYEDVSLSRGDVMHEAFLRLMKTQTAWQNRAHFFATVSLTMRSVLREHARARLADKRSGQRVTLTLASMELGEESMAADLLTLDALLDRLAECDPRGAEVLQLTYFGGLKRGDIALVLGISVPTVDRELRFARAWLAEQLGQHDDR